MTKEQQEEYKKQMLEKYEQQRLENEAIRKRIDLAKEAQGVGPKSDGDEQKGKSVLLNSASAPLTLPMPSSKQGPSESLGSGRAVGPSTLPTQSTGSGSQRTNIPIAISPRPEPDVKQPQQKSSSPLAQEQATSPRQQQISIMPIAGQEVNYSPETLMELEEINALIESVSSNEKLISSEPYDPELESETDRAARLEAERLEAIRKAKEEAERKKREQDSKEIAKKFNFDFTITPVAVPKQKQANELDADFDAMLANLQKATADLDM